MASFSYSYQLASFDPNQVEDCGAVSARDIERAFSTFDWVGQVREANERQVCSPTFSIANIASSRQIWLSAYGEADDFKFLGEYAFELDQPRFLGLGTKKTVASIGTEDHPLNSAREIIQLFLQEDHAGLLKSFNRRAPGDILGRLSQIFIGLLGFLFGGLVTLTSATMLFGMLTDPNAGTDVLLYVALFGIAFAPPVFVAGIRLILGRPNQYGGLFSPNVLRLLAVVNGLIGVAILVLAIQEGDISAIVGGITFILTTQGAFVLASDRALR